MKIYLKFENTSKVYLFRRFINPFKEKNTNIVLIETFSLVSQQHLQPAHCLQHSGTCILIAENKYQYKIIIS